MLTPLDLEVKRKVGVPPSVGSPTWQVRKKVASWNRRS